MPHKHTFTRSDSRFKMHPHRFNKAKSSRLPRRTEGSVIHRRVRVWGSPPRACGCECAARHATARRRFLYLMQNILTVVLNGIKERKVYRELWARRARKEGKEREREDYFSSAGDKHGKTGIRNSLKEGFLVSLVAGGGGGALRSDGVGSKATLCGVLVVKELGLTVGEDFNLRRIWALTNPGRHQSVQILQTCNLPIKQEVTSERRF